MARRRDAEGVLGTRGRYAITELRDVGPDLQAVRLAADIRYDYAAIGSAVNLASRLRDAAGPGEILINQRLQAALQDRIETEPLVNGLQHKGFTKPVDASLLISVRA
jgi:class 3 adenylate cyclase